ncbi:MAG: tetratricopeptide repeat protein [Chloroflexi bacterium]|nr:tetratricopeptide repeat protein [Chloroflexota bacterium]
MLDDFHLLDEVQPIQYFVNRFIQLAGENCHLILSSRSLPEFSDMTLLVAREQVGGLDFSDLSFRPEEIQALLSQNQQIHLSDEDASKLIETTEGWITGLQFTDIDLVRSDGTNFRPSHGVGVSVFDYLGRQVLEHQSDALRTFLLRSSLLEEFDVPLCEAVLAPLYSEPPNWSKLLETIIQKNLFALPVGANGQWLRYHHLFRDYLQGRFRKEYPEEVRPILERLARYNETRGEWEKAYQLYKQLGDINALADLIERAGIPMYQNAMLTLESWLKDLPPSIVQQRAGLLSLRGAVEITKGNVSDGITLFNRAITKFREEINIPGLALTLVRRGIAQRLMGNYKEAIQDADEAIRLTETVDALQLDYATALRAKGLSLYRQGHTFDAVKHLEHARDIYNRLNDAHSIPILLMESGMVYDAMGNYNKAKISYEQALETWKRTGNLSWQASLLNNLGFLYHREGEYERAAEALEEGLLCARQSGYKRMEALISISLGDLYADLEDFEIAEQNYQQVSELVQQLGERFLINYLALARANIALLKKEASRASHILDQVKASIEGSNSYYEYGLYQLLLGRLLLQEGKPQKAVAELMGAKQCFTEDGRYKERILSQIWLAAAYYKNGEQATTREEIKKILQKPYQNDRFVIVAARQAREWLKDLGNDREIKSLLRGLFEKADHLDTLFPRIRRQLRRVTRTTEISAPSLSIQTFGQGQVRINGKPVTMTEWQTQSVRELFFYFLVENKPLTREQIAEALWTDIDEPARLKLRFKNEMYRLRRAVGQEAILFEHDYYQFNSSMEHEYDVEAFETYLARAKSLPILAEQINFYQKAIDLVRGKYLEDIDATWAWPERERLSQKFLSASLQLAELYFKDGQRPKALQICQRALEYDATFEAAYRLMMQIYHRMGDRASVIHTFEACERVMQKIFNLPPSQETQKIYRDLIS